MEYQDEIQIIKYKYTIFDKKNIFSDKYDKICKDYKKFYLNGNPTTKELDYELQLKFLFSVIYSHFDWDKYKHKKHLYHKEASEIDLVFQRHYDSYNFDKHILKEKVESIIEKKKNLAANGHNKFFINNSYLKELLYIIRNGYVINHLNDFKKLQESSSDEKEITKLIIKEVLKHNILSENQLVRYILCGEIKKVNVNHVELDYHESVNFYDIRNVYDFYKNRFNKIIIF